MPGYLPSSNEHKKQVDFNFQCYLPRQDKRNTWASSIIRWIKDNDIMIPSFNGGFERFNPEKLQREYLKKDDLRRKGTGLLY